jgi:hypothetical protein
MEGLQTAHSIKDGPKSTRTTRPAPPHITSDTLANESAHFRAFIYRQIR